MKLRVHRWSLLALLVPLGALAWMQARQEDPPAAPPASVAIPDTPATAAKPADAAGDDAEEVLPPGERLSADNNLSWPVDI